MKRIAIVDSRNPGEGRQNPRGEISYEAFLAYTLLLDPEVLSVTRCFPDIYSPRQDLTGAYDLVLFPNRFTGSPDRLSRITRGNSAVFMVLPDPEQLAVLDPDLRDSCFPEPGYEEPVLSGRETWDIGKPYRYPGDLRYVTFPETGSPPPGVEPGGIGGRPDLIFPDCPRKVILSATDRFHGLAHYRFYGLLGDFTECFTEQFVSIICSALDGKSVPDLNGEQKELRNDFRTFGYVWRLLTVLYARIDESLPVDKVVQDLTGCAERLMQGDTAGTRGCLKELFQKAAELRKAVLPGDIYVMDGFHTGILLKDRGFSELEWPEYAAEWIRNLIDFGKRRGYRFSIEAAAQSMENLCRRFPELKTDIAEAVTSGITELVNGTDAQPYIHLYSASSAAGQLESGHRKFLRLFGSVPRTYAVQEFAFSGSLPSLLKDFGYTFINHTSLHKGTCPEETIPAVQLCAGRGRYIPALPSHPSRTEKDPVHQFWNVFRYLAENRGHGMEICVLTNFCDQMYHPHFREEAFRASRYSDVTGKFVLPRELAAVLAPEGAELPVRNYSMEDYGEELIAGWKYDGDTLAVHEQSLRLEAGLNSLEAVSALAWKAGKVIPDFGFLRECRDFVTEYQHHDILLVPKTYTGSHTGAYALYQGPRELVCLGGCVDPVARGLEESIRERINSAAGEGTGVIINPSGVPRQVSTETGKKTVPPFSCLFALPASNPESARSDREGELVLLRNSLAVFAVDTGTGGIRYAELTGAETPRRWTADSALTVPGRPDITFSFRFDAAERREDGCMVCRLSGEGKAPGQRVIMCRGEYTLFPDRPVLEVSFTVSFLDSLGFFSDSDGKNRYWNGALRNRYRVPENHRAVRNCMDRAEPTRKPRISSLGYLHIQLPEDRRGEELHIGHINSGRIYYEHGKDFFDHLMAVPSRDSNGLINTGSVTVRSRLELSNAPDYTPFRESAMMMNPLITGNLPGTPDHPRPGFDPFKIETSPSVFPYTLRCREGEDRGVCLELMFLEHAGTAGWAEFSVPDTCKAAVTDTAGNKLEPDIPGGNRRRIKAAPGGLTAVLMREID